MILHLIFAVACAVYIIGNYLDYKNSLGRGEQNPNYQRPDGRFDDGKFKRSKIREFLFIAGGALLFEFALSFASPYYAFALLIAVVPLILFGIKGWKLSKL